MKKINPLEYKFNILCKECEKTFPVSLTDGLTPVGPIYSDSVGEYRYILCFYTICPECGEKIYIFEKHMPKRVITFLSENSVQNV